MSTPEAKQLIMSLSQKAALVQARAVFDRLMSGVDNAMAEVPVNPELVRDQWSISTGVTAMMVGYLIDWMSHCEATLAERDIKVDERNTFEKWMTVFLPQIVEGTYNSCSGGRPNGRKMVVSIKFEPTTAEMEAQVVKDGVAG